MKRFTIICALLAWLIVACTTDDNYTLSPTAAVSFSVDTLSLDTVFSTLPSSTRTCWLRNSGSSHIRLSNVALAGGSSSGFRVNIDGIYLCEDNDYSTAELEVRAGDSLRIFVEITPEETGVNTPQPISDALLITTEGGNTQELPLLAYAWDALILNSRELVMSGAFSTAKPIVIFGALIVPEGLTLTLRAGTTLYIHDDAYIDIYGTLIAEGTESRPVTLRGYRLDNMLSYLPYDRVSGQWAGLWFNESSYDNRLTYTDIHSAFNGVVLLDSIVNDRTKLTLDHSRVHNSQGYGIAAFASNITANDCQFTNALYNCFYTDGGTVDLNNCTFAQYYPFDAAREEALAYASASAPLTLNVRNSIIAGYADTQIAMLDSLYSQDVSIDTLNVDITAPEDFFRTFDTTNFIYDFSRKEE